MRWFHIFSFLFIFFYLLFVNQSHVYAQSPPPVIGTINDNRSQYTGNQIPKYDKLEITFFLSTSATNPQWPYDPNTPPGLVSGQGVTADAVFSAPSGKVSTQPAFYYQNYDYQLKTCCAFMGPDWIYPTNNYFWKVRFSPNETGTWSYKINVQDAGGSVSSQTYTFTVVSSSNKGFIKVSQTDPRYFEFADGTYFPGLGYNMNYNQISWENPVSSNEYNFQVMQQNGIQLVRHWLSQWSIFGSWGQPWKSIVRGYNYVGLTVDIPTNPDKTTRIDNKVAPGSDASMFLGWSSDTSVWEGSPCMDFERDKAPAIKPNTSYHLSIKYRIPRTLSGPNVAGQPYGLVAKFGGWLLGTNLLPAGTTWRTNQECAYPAALVNQVNAGMEKVLTPYAFQATSGWSTLETDFISDNATTHGWDFLPKLYLATENITGDITGGSGMVYIDNIEIREKLIGGGLGPNIINKAWMSNDLYFDQKSSYTMDKVLETAEKYNIYLKLVVLDKGDFIYNSFDYNGQPYTYTYANNDNFYGNGTITRTEWLLRSWWRYVQARWGYSSSIHSWELVNESDPWSTKNYAQIERFTQYMHQFGANSHLASSSMWTSYPEYQFWSNPLYPSADYVDVHCCYKKKDNTETANISYRTPTGSQLDVAPAVSSPNDFYDTTNANYKTGQIFGTLGQYGIKTKPTMKGEFGYFVTDANDLSNPINADIFIADTNAVWLHNYVWGQINSSGLYESSYWYPNIHMYRPNNGSTFDHRIVFGSYYKFIKDIPLSNGNYVDSGASSSDTNIRVWGQKDIVNKRAHLWIQNTTHNWCAAARLNPTPTVTAGTPTPTPINWSSCPNTWDNSRLTGTVSLGGFSPNTSYPLEWWNFDNNVTLTKSTGTIYSDSTGNIILDLNSLPSSVTDTGVKIGDYSNSPIPTPAPVGDINGDGKIDMLDFLLLAIKYSNSDVAADLNKDGVVNMIDGGMLINNIGK